MSVLAVKKRSNIIRNNKRENKNIWRKCSGELDEFFVCNSCGNNSYITAKQRILHISDKNTFKELKLDKVDISKKCNYEDKIIKAQERTNLDEAINYAYKIKDQGHKYILLENDLPDNY